MNQQDAFQVWYLGFFGKPFPIEVGEQDYWIRVAWDAGYTAGREAALEEAAKVCDLRSKDKEGKLPSPVAYKQEAMLCAAAIRALKNAPDADRSR